MLSPVFVLQLPLPSTPSPLSLLQCPARWKFPGWSLATQPLMDLVLEAHLRHRYRSLCAQSQWRWRPQLQSQRWPELFRRAGFAYLNSEAPVFLAVESCYRVALPSLVVGQSALRAGSPVSRCHRGEQVFLASVVKSPLSSPRFGQLPVLAREAQFVALHDILRCADSGWPVH